MKDIIKAFRKEKKLTQAEFAELLGVSHSAVGMWEIGARTPPTYRLPEIARVLDCSIDDLFDRQDKPA